MSENLFGLTVAADKGLDDLQCQRLLSENRRYQEVMLQYRCALKALESRLEMCIRDRLYGGVSGDADAAVSALLSGNLGYDPNVHCDHHDHEHGEDGHTCGDHGCGKHSCH